MSINAQNREDGEINNDINTLPLNSRWRDLSTVSRGWSHSCQALAKSRLCHPKSLTTSGHGNTAPNGHVSGVCCIFKSRHGPAGTSAPKV